MSKTKTKDAPAASVEIASVALETARIPIIGTAPLIMHRWSEKAKRELAERAMKRAKPKETPDPQAEYEAAMYLIEEGRLGFPAIGFKRAMVGGARVFGKELTMTALKQFVFIDGEMGTHIQSDGQKLVEIIGEVRMREDVVRVGQGTSMRYRPEIIDWHATLLVTYAKNMLTFDTVMALVNAAGFGVGIGDWRPEKNGSFGTFAIDTNKEIEIVG